jgi:pyruvate formate lyase activating enzyme
MTTLDRRRFLERALGSCALTAAAGLTPGLGALEGLLDLGGTALAAESLASLLERAPAARYQASTLRPDTCGACHDPASSIMGGEHAHSQALVKCLLCARECLIEPGGRGMCRARVNVGGELRSLVYGRPISTHVDPIEKKPFYHFLPGSDAFSMATSGCPLRCQFCQNWRISQASPEDYDSAYVSPQQLVGRVRARRAPVIAYTYNEPTVFLEYLSDIARLGREQQLRSVLISCGYASEPAMGELCDVLDAVKIDLKGFSERFYREVCEAELAPVLRSIKQVRARGLHLELVNLVVPTLNDAEGDLKEMSKWIAGELGPDVPVHFTRFHPDYRLQNLPPTPVETLERARAIAMDQGLHYAYVGNVPGHPGNSTYCPACGELVIGRKGFIITDNRLDDGRCSACDAPIAGVWR